MFGDVGRADQRPVGDILLQVTALVRRQESRGRPTLRGESSITPAPRRTSLCGVDHRIFINYRGENSPA